MPELGSAVFKIRTDAKDFHKDLDKAETHANKMAANIGDSMTGVDKSTKKAGSSIQSFSADLKDARGSSKGLNEEVKRTNTTVNQSGGLIKRITGYIKSWGTETKKTSKEHDTLITKLLKANIATKFLGNTFKLLKWPALITGAGLAVQALAQLTAGAYALISAMGPLSGALVAMPTAIGVLVQSMITVKLAMSGVGDAFKDWGKELKKATPEANTFAQSLKRFTPDIRQLQRAAQRGLFKGLTNGIEAASRNLPAFRRGLMDTGFALGHVASNFGKLLGSREFGSRFKSIVGTNNRIIGILGDALTHLGMAASRVMVAARPLLVFMARGVDKFAKWADGATQAGLKTGEMAGFFHQTQVAMKRWGSIVGNVLTGLYNISKLSAPAGRDLARSLDIASGHFRKWTESTKGKNEIKKYFDDIVPSLEAMGRLARSITRAFFRMGKDNNLGPLFDELRTQVLPVLEQLLTQTAKSMGPAFIDLLTNVGKLVAVFVGQSGPLLIFVQALAKLTGALASILNQSPELQSMMVTFVGFAGVAKAIKFTAAITGISKLLGLTKAATVQTGELAAAEAAAGGAAGKSGALTGAKFMRGMQGAAIAGIAGWEIGTALRNHVPAVRSAGDFLGKTFANVFGMGVDKAAEKASENLYKSTVKAADNFKRAKDPVDKMRASLQLHKNAAEASVRALAKQQAQLILTGASMTGTDKKSQKLRDVTDALKQKEREAAAASRGMGRDLDKLGVNFKNLGGTVAGTASYIAAATNQVLAGLGAKTIRFSLQRSKALQGYGGVSSHATGGIPNVGAGAADDHLLISPSGRPVAAMSGSEGIVNGPQMGYIDAALGMSAAMGMGPYSSLNSLWGSGMTHKKGGLLKYAGGGQLPGGKILELLWRVPDHFDHLHVAMSSGIVGLGRKLQKMGYQVSENPAFGGVRGKHADGSYHYSGQAIDVNADGKPGGEASWLDKLYRMLKSGKLAGGAGQLGQVKINGPAGIMHTIAQLAANKMRAAANAKLSKYSGGIGSSGAEGSYGKGALKRLWTQAGGPGGSIANVAAAIALAESGGNPRARNASGASGLWQILGQVVGGNIFNPLVNAKNAVKKWRDAHGFTPWTTYTGADTPGHAKTYMRYLRKGGIARARRGRRPPKPKFNVGILHAFNPGRIAAATANAALAAAQGDVTGERTAQTQLAGGLQGRIDVARKILASGRAAHPNQMKATLTDLINQQREANSRVAEIDQTIKYAANTQASAEARLTSTLEDDIKAAQDLVNMRKQEYEDAKKTGDPAKIAEAAGNLADANDSLAGLQSQLPTEEDYVQAKIAQARLTSTMQDDIDAQNALKTLREKQYNEAVASGDPRRIAEAANALADLTDQEQQSLSDLAEEIKSLRDEVAKQNAYAASVGGVTIGTVWKAMGDALSGQIVGVGYNGRNRSAGTGALARY